MDAACGSDLNECLDCDDIEKGQESKSRHGNEMHTGPLKERASVARALLIKSWEGDPAPDQQRVIKSKETCPFTDSTFIIS